MTWRTTFVVAVPEIISLSVHDLWKRRPGSRRPTVTICLTQACNIPSFLEPHFRLRTLSSKLALSGLLEGPPRGPNWGMVHRARPAAPPLVLMRYFRLDNIPKRAGTVLGRDGQPAGGCSQLEAAAFGLYPCPLQPYLSFQMFFSLKHPPAG